MDSVRRLRIAAQATQAQLAEAAGTSQPTVAAYEGGTKSPTMRTLERLATSVGLEPFVHFHPPMTREERRSLALHEAIAERLADEPDMVLERAKETLTRMWKVASANSQPLREWSVLLDRPLPDLLPLLTDPSPWARELRHVTPFAGVLSAAERAAVYRRLREENRRVVGRRSGVPLTPPPPARPPG